MDTVAICIIVNNNFFEAKVCIENLLSKTKVPVKLYILNNASTDPRVSEYFVSLCMENKWQYQSTPFEYNLSMCYNSIVKLVTEKYCCIFPINIFVNRNWLEDLIFTMENVKAETGVLSIRTGTEKPFLMPILHDHPSGEYELQHVWFTENNTVDGILFFKSDIFSKPGYFDEKLPAPGFETSEMVFRISAFGYKNYYIRNQSAAKAVIPNDLLFPRKTEESMKIFKNAIEAMVKTKQFSK
jgi:hypothetical protein